MSKIIITIEDDDDGENVQITTSGDYVLGKSERPTVAQLYFLQLLLNNPDLIEAKNE
jgi:hypothetical protein